MGWLRGGSSLPDIKTLKRRMLSAWDLKGSLNVVEMGKGLWLFKFDSKKEAEKILRVGSRKMGIFLFP